MGIYYEREDHYDLTCQISPRLKYATTLIILTLVVCACGRTPSNESEVYRDDLGRDVTLNRPVDRVVTFAPSLTEMVFAVGAGDRLVGVGIPDNFPPAIRNLPRFSTYPLDFEAIIALNPDLAVATDQVNSPRDAETLAALDIPTYFLTFGSLNDVLDGMLQLGELLGTRSAAEDTVDSLRRELEHLKSRAKARATRPDVLVLIGQETLFSFGSESYVHEMIEAAGGRSVTGTLEARAPVLSEEFVLRQQPDVIIGAWRNDITANHLLEFHPEWHVLPAVRHGRIYGIDPDLLQRPGPRLIAGIREISRVLHGGGEDRSTTYSPAP